MELQTLLDQLPQFGLGAVFLYLYLRESSLRDKERVEALKRLDDEREGRIQDLKDCAGMTPHIVRDTRRVVVADETRAKGREWLNGQDPDNNQ